MVVKKACFGALFVLVLIGLIGVAAAGNIGIMSVAPSAYISSPEDFVIYSFAVNNFSWTFNPGSGATIYNCSYTFDGGATLNLIDCYAGVYNFGVLADGNHSLNFVCDWSLGAHFGPASLSGADFMIDTIPPQFSGFSESPASPVTYVQGQSYEFNITVVDAGVGVDSVWAKFDGQDYPVTKTGNTYSFIVSDLGADTYNYEWFANDTLGNAGSSGVYTYVVSPANPVPGMNASLIGTTPIFYGTISDFTAPKTGVNAGDGGCEYNLTPSNDKFRAGVVTFNYSTTGCENYSAGFVAKDLTINPAPTTTAVSSSVSSPITYGDLVSFSCSNNASLTTELYIDGVNRTSEMGVALVLGAKTSYNVTCFGIANQNYTGSFGNISFVVNKAPQNAVLNFVPDSPITYKTSVNVACNGSLFRNDVNVTDEIGQDVLLGAGNYNYSCKLYETANYLFNEMNSTLVVNKADPTIVGSPVLSIVILPMNPVDVGTETNVTGVGCPSELNCTLYRDGEEVNNSDVQIFGAGTHFYVYNTTGNENYSAVGVSANLDIIGPLHVGGGGGGGGSCFSNWTCTSWGACDKGTQTRACSLIYGSCYAMGEKPSESQSCGPGGLNNTNASLGTQATKIMDQGGNAAGGAGITGAAIGGLSGGSWLIIGIFAAAIAGAYGFTVWRKNRFRSALEKTLWQAAHSNIKK